MSGGFSSARLDRMRHVLAGYVHRGEMPGLVALVSRRDDTHVHAVGAQALGGNRPMRRDSIFRIAMDSPEPPRAYVDFWTLAYQALDD
jgi:Beta-lactamase